MDINDPLKFPEPLLISTEKVLPTLKGDETSKPNTIVSPWQACKLIDSLLVDCPFMDIDPIIIIIESKTFLIEVFGLSSHSV